MYRGDAKKQYTVSFWGCSDRRFRAEQGTVEITLRKDECKEKLQQAARILSALFGDSRLLKQAADVKSAKK